MVNSTVALYKVHARRQRQRGSAGSAHRDQGGFQIEYVGEMTPRRGTTVRVYKLATKTALESEVKDNRTDRRRLPLLVLLTSTFRSLVFGRPEEMLTTSWTCGAACHNFVWAPAGTESKTQESCILSKFSEGKKN